MTRRRLTLLIALAAVALLAGTGALVLQALAGAVAEDRSRHQVIAERLFDELEQELVELVDREEARSFLEYRYFYIPERQVAGTAALVRSPISELPADGVILGYFQIEPSGELYNPARPRDNELQLACDSEDYTPSSALEDLDTELERLIATVDWTAGDAEPVHAVPPPPPVESGYASRYQEAVQSLNRSSRRARKSDQSVPVSGNNVYGFSNDDMNIQQLATADAGLGPAPAVLPPVTDFAGEQVDVVVSPMRGSRVGDYTLLHRTVRIGEQTWRQGVALSTAALTAHIEQAVLQGSELAPYVMVDWSGGGAGAYRFTHHFAAPFAHLQAAAVMEEIPGAVSGQQQAVLALATLTAAALVLGFLAISAMVRGELELIQRRSDFVAAVTHELKTPLTAIRMYGEMLRDGMVPEARRVKYYTTITEESERLSRLIDNVLTLSRLEKGSGLVQLRVGEVGPAVERAVAVLRPHAQQRGFSLDVRIAPALPPVAIDEDALAQVLVNLVDNALKFAADAPDKRIELEVVALEGAIQLRVRDRGPGVPARQLSRIFQPFYRGERELTRQTQGTGIGLALVEGLVGGMGGTVSARNHPGGGFEIAVRLPAAG